MAVCFRYARYRLPRFLPPARLSKPALPPQPAAGLTASHWTLFQSKSFFSDFRRICGRRPCVPFSDPLSARLCASFRKSRPERSLFSPESPSLASSAIGRPPRLMSLSLADRLPGVRERHGYERIAIHHPYVVDLVVRQPTLAFQHVGQFAGVETVHFADRDEQPRRSFAVDVDRTDFGVAALFEFVFERQFQQGRQRHFRVEVLQHLAGHFGIFAVRLAFDDFDQVVLDLGLFDLDDVLRRRQGDFL